MKLVVASLPLLSITFVGNEARVIVTNTSVIAPSPVPVYQWQDNGDLASGVYTNIDGANDVTYDFSSHDVTRPFLRLSVSYTHIDSGVGLTNVISPPVLLTPILPTPVIVQNGRNVSISLNGFPAGAIDNKSILQYLTASTALGINIIPCSEGHNSINCRPELSQYASGSDATTGEFIFADSYFFRSAFAGSEAISNTSDGLGFWLGSDVANGPLRRVVRMIMEYKIATDSETYTLESNFIILTLAADVAQVVGIGTNSRTLSVRIPSTQASLLTSDNNASFQWQSAPAVDGSYTDIASAANDSVYIAPSPLLTDNRFYRAVWQYNYVRGAQVAGITITLSHEIAIPVVPTLGLELPPVLGQAKVSIVGGSGVTADAPEAVFQWQNAAAADGTFEDISGATGTTYLINDRYDSNRPFLRVALSYTHTTEDIRITSYSPVKSAIILPRFSIASSGTEAEVNIANDHVISATPAATYQWQDSATPSGSYADISGATNATYDFASHRASHPFLRVSVSYTHTTPAVGATEVVSSPILLTSRVSKPRIEQNGKNISLVSDGFPVGAIDKSSILQYLRVSTGIVSNICFGNLNSDKCRPVIGQYASGSDAATGKFILADSYFFRSGLNASPPLSNDSDGLGFWLGQNIILSPLRRVVRMLVEYKVVAGGETYTLESNFVSLTFPADVAQVMGSGTGGRNLSIRVVPDNKVSLFKLASGASFQWQRAATADGIYTNIVAAAQGSVYNAPSALHR